MTIKEGALAVVMRQTYSFPRGKNDELKPGEYFSVGRYIPVEEGMFEVAVYHGYNYMGYPNNEVWVPAEDVAPLMKQGALARVTTETRDLAYPSAFGTRVYPVGFEFEVDDFVPDGEVDDKPVAFYWGSANGGMGNVCVLASVVEQAKTAEEMNARTLPEPKDLLGFIVSALLSEHDGIELDEVSRNGNIIEGFGTVEDGLPFGFSFVIPEMSIWRTDD